MTAAVFNGRRMPSRGVLKLPSRNSEFKDDAMPDERNTLRAMVSRWAGGLQAQLLELDIAVQGADEQQLYAEIAHAITVSYEIAVKHGEAPFSSIGEPPKPIRDQWRPSNASKPGWIQLREEVAMALATALRWRKPVGSVTLEEAMCA